MGFLLFHDWSCITFCLYKTRPYIKVTCNNLLHHEFFCINISRLIVSVVCSSSGILTWNVFIRNLVMVLRLMLYSNRPLFTCMEGTTNLNSRFLQYQKFVSVFLVHIVYFIIFKVLCMSFMMLPTFEHSNLCKKLFIG